ncbi:DUF3500 domain-containing protein (plasmid) [Mycolicibacterium psychrotolerans]|uniref:DUF3500 domain-containing protein n=1 Tax=Mycolicibacterium psychrotolerans TaxID=216929 RepID=UPI003D67F60C
MIYKGFGPRPPGLPLKGGAVDFADQAGVERMLQLIGDAPLPPVEATASEPFLGVTTNGTPMTGLYPFSDEGFDPRPATAAAHAYLDAVPEHVRAHAVSPIRSEHWQLWTNAFLTFPEHGVRLADLGADLRGAALEVIRCSLSSAGYRRVRGAMRLNADLGQFLNAYLDTLTEWCYWFTIFGDPSTDKPWGWQLAGHHVDVHCLVLGGQLVLTPTFLGAEFRSEELFAENRLCALEFIHSLNSGQRSDAVLYDSMDYLPAHLKGAVDGRHRAGAGRDNVVLPYEGLCVDGLSAGQHRLLLALIDAHIDAIPEAAAPARRRQIEAHLDESWVSWIGGVSVDDPFYYKLHSPVLLVEYDNHPGIFLDNDRPEPFHVHTIVRSPNGGDYGKDLLAQHYASHH